MSSASVAIEKLAFGGSGVGRLDGKVCFVPYSCPGDLVEVRVKNEKRSYMNAEIARMISPSDTRVVPVCPLFGSCGGCNWQHIDYAAQLAAKRQIFAETMWRGARVENDVIGEVVPSDMQYGYRSRVQFKLHGRNGRIQVGFFRQGTHFVEDAPEGCPVAMPVINAALKNLRDVLASFPEPDRIPQINIDCAEQGVVAIVNYIGADSRAAGDFFEGCRSLLPELTALYLQTGRKHTMVRVFGDNLLAYTLPSRSGDSCRLAFRPGGFSQVNLLQNRKLLELVREMADFDGSEYLLDLYCGNGNFSLPLSGDVAAVTGVEGYEASIDAARENAAYNAIKNAGFICDDAAAAVKRLLSEGGRFDVVLLDPPRTGAADVIDSLLQICPSKIIYISCDPSTLARDCGALTKDGIYRVTSSIPVDMFPQTYHLESVTLLERC